MDSKRMYVLAGVLAFTLGALAAPAAADERLELMRQGKAAFESQCMNCHKTIDEAVGGYRAAPSVKQLVTDMVAKGAKLDEKQQAAVAEYVSGRMVLMSQCRNCHTINRPLTANKSREEWKSTVERMVGKMPPALKMSPEKVELLSLYLAVERPPK